MAFALPFIRNLNPNFAAFCISSSLTISTSLPLKYFSINSRLPIKISSTKDFLKAFFAALKISSSLAPTITSLLDSSLTKKLSISEKFFINHSYSL